MNNIEKVNSALCSSLQGKTKLSGSIFDIEGKSSKRFRIFLNEICSKSSAFLEVGSFKGSTLCAAAYKNSISAYAIDNFSLFNKSGDVKQCLMSNIKKAGADVSFYDEDCWSFDVSKIDKKIDVFFYDGSHSKKEQAMALEKFYDCLSDEFIFIVDDFNWEGVRQGTVESIERMEKEKIITIEYSVSITNSKKTRDLSTWWNGMAVFCVKKQEIRNDTRDFNKKR